MPNGSAPAARRGEAGYNLVVLTMAITLLNVFIAAALPLWSAVIRRDREEEAISRGLQYAEAIRVFQRRFGRLPNRLQELVEVEPRSIRRLWKDPLTEDGAWAVIVQLPQGGSIAIDPETGLPIDPLAPAQPGGPRPGQPPGSPGDLPPSGGGAEQDGGTPQPVNGPIRGVKSRAKGEAFQSFFGAETYESWEFTVDLLLRATSQPGSAGMPRWNALTVGRPFRFPPPGAGQGGPVPGIGPVPQPVPGPGPRPRPGGDRGGRG
jgi:type II secretory pathway pseudopilin PulG